MSTDRYDSKDGNRLDTHLRLTTFNVRLLLYVFNLPGYWITSWMQHHISKRVPGVGGILVCRTMVKIHTNVNKLFEGRGSGTFSRSRPNVCYMVVLKWWSKGSTGQQRALQWVTEYEAPGYNIKARAFSPGRELSMPVICQTKRTR